MASRRNYLENHRNGLKERHNSLSLSPFPSPCHPTIALKSRPRALSHKTSTTKPQTPGPASKAVGGRLACIVT